MSERDDYDAIRSTVDRYYTRALEKYGPTARGVDWNGQKSQELRFRQLLRLCGEGHGGTLLDFGCGYGALLGYVRQRGVDLDYVGFDISKAMVEKAREIHGNDSRARFTCDDAELEEEDFCVASGVLNVKLDVAAEAWDRYVLSVLDRLHALGRRGFAFNALTSYSDPHHMRSNLHYSDPGRLFDHCKRNYARDVALLHDYGLYEFTMIVRKAAPGSEDPS